MQSTSEVYRSPFLKCTIVHPLEAPPHPFALPELSWQPISTSRTVNAIAMPNSHTVTRSDMRLYESYISPSPKAHMAFKAPLFKLIRKTSDFLDQITGATIPAEVMQEERRMRDEKRKWKCCACNMVFAGHRELGKVSLTCRTATTSQCARLALPIVLGCPVWLSMTLTHPQHFHLFSDHVEIIEARRQGRPPTLHSSSASAGMTL